jgi:hypothetical protein
VAVSGIVGKRLTFDELTGKTADQHEPSHTASRHEAEKNTKPPYCFMALFALRYP